MLDPYAVLGLGTLTLTLTLSLPLSQPSTRRCLILTRYSAWRGVLARTRSSRRALNPNPNPTPSPKSKSNPNPNPSPNPQQAYRKAALQWHPDKAPTLTTPTLPLTPPTPNSIPNPNPNPIPHPNQARERGGGAEAEAAAERL